MIRKCVLLCLLLLSIVPFALAQPFSEKYIVKDFKNNTDLPTVAIITTGGTIAQKLNDKVKAVVPTVSGEELVHSVPDILNIANIKLINFSNIDSSQMSPEIWLELSQVIDELLKDEKIDGVVVVHGTDTMSEGAYFLDLLLNNSKPVVFTGASRNASELSADGPMNLYNAVLTASSEQMQNCGVVVAFNQYIDLAFDVRKSHTSNLQAFDSGEKGHFGYIMGNKVVKFHDCSVSEKQHFLLPKVLPKVVLIKVFAGDDGSLIRYSVDSGISGIVIEGFGAGNVNTNVFEAIKYALSKNIAVAISSQVQNGEALPIYGGSGGVSLQTAGAVLTHRLQASKARIFLMLALANGSSDIASLLAN